MRFLYLGMSSRRAFKIAGNNEVTITVGIKFHASLKVETVAYAPASFTPAMFCSIIASIFYHIEGYRNTRNN